MRPGPELPGTRLAAKLLGGAAARQRCGPTHEVLYAAAAPTAGGRPCERIAAAAIALKNKGKK